MTAVDEAAAGDDRALAATLEHKTYCDHCAKKGLGSSRLLRGRLLHEKNDFDPAIRAKIDAIDDSVK